MAPGSPAGPTLRTSSSDAAGLPAAVLSSRAASAGLRMWLMAASQLA